MEKYDHQLLVGTKVGGFAGPVILWINICMLFGLERESSNLFADCKWKPIPSRSMILMNHVQHLL